MSLLMDMTLKDFNNLLASSTPAPGGGSTAALSGVLASALTLMVANLSFGKKSYEALDENIKYKIAADYEAVKTLNKELAGLVDEDSIAFNQVMAAMKMPRETEADRGCRAESMEQAGQYALRVPLTTAEKCLQILKHQIDIARYGNKNTVSDIGVGALLAWAGLEGAVLNVKVNLPGIKDQAIKNDAEEKISAYLVEGEQLKDKILTIVDGR
ncbi:MAG: cyclodeaminase/cyclohydrolase family protein [Syntrophomonas sp.]